MRPTYFQAAVLLVGFVVFIALLAIYLGGETR